MCDLASLKMDWSSSSDDELILMALLLDEEEANRNGATKRKIIKKRTTRKWIRPRLEARKLEGEHWTLFKDLLKYDDRFYQYFRMPQCKFYELLKSIEPALQKQNTALREAISPSERLAVCLRFLATGDSFRKLASSYRLGHSTVHSIVMEACEAIIEKLMPLVMPTPTADQWKNIAKEFWKIWKFPNCVGALGGKNVIIQSLNSRSELTIVLLTLVDAHCKIIAVDVGNYDRNRNGAGGLFANSKMGTDLEQNKLKIPKGAALPNAPQTLTPYVAIGDESFPLKKYLLRPYPGSHVHDDEAKNNFNRRLAHARTASENAFGMLGEKFRLYNQKLKLKKNGICGKNRFGDVRFAQLSARRR